MKLDEIKQKELLDMFKISHYCLVNKYQGQDSKIIRDEYIVYIPEDTESFSLFIQQECPAFILSFCIDNQYNIVYRFNKMVSENMFEDEDIVLCDTASIPSEYLFKYGEERRKSIEDRIKYLTANKLSVFSNIRPTKADIDLIFQKLLERDNNMVFYLNNIRKIKSNTEIQELRKLHELKTKYQKSAQ